MQVFPKRYRRNRTIRIPALRRPRRSSPESRVQSERELTLTMVREETSANLIGQKAALSMTFLSPAALNLETISLVSRAEVSRAESRSRSPWHRPDRRSFPAPRTRPGGTAEVRPDKGRVYLEILLLLETGFLGLALAALDGFSVSHSL